MNQIKIYYNHAREGLISELMRETEEVASRRKACKEMKELLQRALEILNEVMKKISSSFILLHFALPSSVLFCLGLPYLIFSMIHLNLFLYFLSFCAGPRL